MGCGKVIHWDCARKVLGEAIAPEVASPGEAYLSGVLAIGIGAVEVADCGALSACQSGGGCDEEGGEFHCERC